MNKELTLTMAVLSVEALEVDKDGYVSLKVEDLRNVEAQLKKLTDDVKTLTDDKALAEQHLSDVVAKLDEIDPTVKAAKDTDAKISAINAKLAARPVTKPDNPQGQASVTPKDNVDWEEIDNLPHNKAVDAEYVNS